MVLKKLPLLFSYNLLVSPMKQDKNYQTDIIFLNTPIIVLFFLANSHLKSQMIFTTIFLFLVFKYGYSDLNN